MPRIRFHDLRHSYVGLLIDQGEHSKYIQNQLGHSSIQVTMDIYGHLMKDVNREAASKLGRTVLGGKTKAKSGEPKGDGSKTVAVKEKGVTLH